MIEVEFIGAARTVTGSKHLVRTSRAAVLLDCGLYQGRRAEANLRNRKLVVPVRELSAVVLSHAHIDHSGALPRLHKNGYRGQVHLTPATRDLCAPMLADAAMIQAADARFIARLIEEGRADPSLLPVEPLYDIEDVRGVLGRMVPLPYRVPRVIAPGIRLRFLDAGHVLGSAIAVLDIEDEGRTTRLAFTGDLGRRGIPLLRDPEVPDGVHTLLLESTYGDRLHDGVERMDEALLDTVLRTAKRGGKVLIPSFALERAQEVVYSLKRLHRSGRLPQMPVYVDSPLTVKITEVFKLHPDCYDDEVFATLHGDDSPFAFPGLRYVRGVEESMAVTADPRPSIVISASGMCEGGRILHHLKSLVSHPRNTVLFVGFQAEHTLGRRIVEQASEVRIFGLMTPRRAEVVSLQGFSAHADQAGLLEFAEETRERGRLRRIALVHGEPAAQAALEGELLARGFPTVVVPSAGDRLRI